MKKVIGTISLIVLVLGLFAAYPIAYRTSAETVTFTVRKAERVTQNSGEGVAAKYLVYSEAEETFEITDSWLFGRFDSSDLYGRIEDGKTYRCKVVGWRSGFMSTYRNILHATEVQPGELMEPLGDEPLPAVEEGDTKDEEDKDSF